VAHILLSAADLCLDAHIDADGAEAPLPFGQLTGLWLQSSDHNTTEILAMTSGLPRLEELAVHLDTTFDLYVLDAAALLRLPQLRLLDLSGSPLWDSHHPGESDEHMPMCEVERLMHLQRVCPHIEWVLRKSGQRG
jgi:hypothetical protein